MTLQAHGRQYRRVNESDTYSAQPETRGFKQTRTNQLALVCPTPPTQYLVSQTTLGKEQSGPAPTGKYTCIFIILCKHYINIVTKSLT